MPRRTAGLRPALLFCLFALAPPGAGAALSPDGAPRPFENWRFGSELGVLQKVGGNATPLNYTLVSAFASAVSPPHPERETDYGRFALRARFSLFAEAVVEGPENLFAGAVAGPLLEWTPPGAGFELYGSAGGGAGWIDSRGRKTPGAQGRDLNFVWYLNAGVARELGGEWRVSLGFYFQHLSNAGLSEINPGLDAIGPRIGVSRAF